MKDVIVIYLIIIIFIPEVAYKRFSKLYLIIYLIFGFPKIFYQENTRVRGGKNSLGVCNWIDNCKNNNFTFFDNAFSFGNKIILEKSYCSENIDVLELSGQR